MTEIDTINKLFNVDLAADCQYRQFPQGESSEFLYLEGMESQHRTYWNDEIKVKVYEEEYGNHLDNCISDFKYYARPNGAEYLKYYLCGMRLQDGQAFFLFDMVKGQDLLFDLVDNFSVDRAVDHIVDAYHAMEHNAICQLPDDKYLVAHDYKLFNIIKDAGACLMFDYDRFSIVDDLNMFVREFWRNVEVDDLGAAVLGLDKETQQEILKKSHERISNLPT
jgi:hypothetical protein